MHVTLRRYAEVGARMYEMVFREVEAGLVPMLKAEPGFRFYCAFLNEEGEGVSVTAFDEREQAIRANEQVFGWVEANLRDLLPDPPEVLAGEVRREVQGQGRGGAEGAYVVIRQYDGVRSIERLTALADEHVLPVIRQAPGLWGHYAFTSGQDQGRVVAVSVFDTRENAMRVSDQVVGIMRERAKDLVPNPPRVTAGEAAVAASA